MTQTTAPTTTTTPAHDTSQILSPEEALRLELEAYVRENPPFTDDELREDPAADRYGWAER